MNPQQRPSDSWNFLLSLPLQASGRSLSFISWKCTCRAEAEGGGVDEKQDDVAVGRLLRAPSFFLLLISAMLGAAIITILDPTLGPHLEDILDYGPGTIGVAFAVIAAVYAAFTPFAG